MLRRLVMCGAVLLAGGAAASGVRYKCADGSWQEACPGSAEEPAYLARKAREAKEASFSAAIADLRRGMMPFCGARWPDNWTMQQACWRNQDAGLHEYAEFMRQHDGAPQAALGAMCLLKWTRDGSTDMALVAACIRNNL